MFNCHNRNKNELLVLTGAVYSFVAYLTAFTLEILFIIDLAKRNNGLMLSAAGATGPNQFDLNNGSSATTTTLFEQASMALENMQTHLTISCLAISILYFIIFIASLILIISLILQSTFFLLIWMCLMATMYLPEFGLIIYVSLYGWGLATRNGQTELIFYLFRSALNVIFIFRAYKLYKDWNYDKNFFIMKSSSNLFAGSAPNLNGNRYSSNFNHLFSSSNSSSQRLNNRHHRFSSAEYDSPYFIGGNNDSLTTTINPLFSGSSLNLNTSARNSGSFDFNQNHHHHHRTGRNNFRYNFDDDEDDAIINFDDKKQRNHANRERVKSDQMALDLAFESAGRKFKFLHGGNSDERRKRNSSPSYLIRPNSVLSINDNDSFEDFELDLDYRTLTQQCNQHNQADAKQHFAPIQGRRADHEAMLHGGAISGAGSGRHAATSGSNLSYSTQSLDRRQLNDLDFAMPEQVILRPLTHKPFDYLQRPGGISNSSTSNLSSLQQPAVSTQQASQQAQLFGPSARGTRSSNRNEQYQF